MISFVVVLSFSLWGLLIGSTVPRRAHSVVEDGHVLLSSATLYASASLAHKLEGIRRTPRVEPQLLFGVVEGSVTVPPWPQTTHTVDFYNSRNSTVGLKEPVVPQ